MPSTGSPGRDRGRRGGFQTRPYKTRPYKTRPYLLPLIAFLLAALTAPGLVRGDVAGVYVTAAALIERGHPAIDGAIAALAPAPHGADAPPGAYGPLAYAAGHYYHNAPPGPALLAAPLYLLGLALAPLLGPETPALLVVLLGPLLGALSVAALARRMVPHGARRFDRTHGHRLSRRGAVLVAAGGLALWLLAYAPTAPIVVAALVSWLLPLAARLWDGRGAPAPAFVVGAGFGALVLLDYTAGVLGAVAILLLLARCRRRPDLALAVLSGAAVPVLVLAAYATVAFGKPWALPFRFAVHPSDRAVIAVSLASVRSGALLAALVPFAPYVVGWAVQVPPRRPPLANFRDSRVGLYALLLVPLAIVALPAALALRRGEVVLPLDWRAPGTLVALLIVAAGMAVAFALAGRAPSWSGPGAAAPLALILALAVFARLGASGQTAAASPEGRESYAAPFALSAGGEGRPIWTLDRGARLTESSWVQLDPGARATSPWIDITPGAAYRVRIASTGPLGVTFGWEDMARRRLVQQASERAVDGEWDATFTAPVGAAGLRLGLVAGAAEATVRGVDLALTAGARIEPFPEGQRAALAFSFDWESAMGGLIHSRSAAASGEGEGSRVGLTADGSPSVAEAEEKALRMRDGARFLAGEFARHGIRATFYATGYNLLRGNPTCEEFLGNPIYRNVNRANGWGSDYWRTHPWYEHDPCTTEEEAPAWYFASETRALAAAGHEIASHSFGHLYVRGVSPAQLEADLAQWDRAARALGVPVAPSFAFPWTSSNSLDGNFFAVFERLGLTVLTRLFPQPRQSYELERVRENPALAVFPDRYLPSTPRERDEALAGIDEAIARRGYFSLWTHPNEAVEQGGQVIWPQVIAAAAAARDRGLWVAPVAEIAGYSLATREVSITALPVARGTRLAVENRSGRSLEGVTLALPSAGGQVTIDGRPAAAVQGNQLRLPPLAPGVRVVVLVQR